MRVYKFTWPGPQAPLANVPTLLEPWLQFCHPEAAWPCVALADAVEPDPLAEELLVRVLASEYVIVLDPVLTHDPTADSVYDPPVP